MGKSSPANLLISSFFSAILFCAPLSAAPILDLKDWNPKKSTIRFDSGWTFHWHELLEPSSVIQDQGIDLGRELCWQKIINPASQAKFPSGGYATYSIAFKGLPSRPEGYDLFIRSAATAYKAYIYPADHPEEALTFANGLVGITAETSIPQPLPQSLNFFPSDSDQVWHILIQVSNFHHNRSGLWQPPEISPGGLLRSRNQWEREGFIFSIGCVFIIGTYNFMIFMRRRNEYSTLALTLFCTVVAVRTIATSDLIAYYNPIPSLKLYNLKYWIEYATMVLGPYTFATFLHFSFEQIAIRRVAILETVLSIALCLAVSLTSPGIYTKAVVVFQSVAFVVVALSSFSLYRAMRRRLDGAQLALMGTAVMTFALTYDILVQHGVFSPPFIVPYGVILFVFLQSQVVAKHFATAFSTAERLQRDLQKEVDRQTANIRSLMEHVPLGIFMIQKDLTIQKGYSLQLEQIFHRRDLQDQPALEVIFNQSSLTEEQRSIVSSCLIASLGEDSLFWDLNVSQFPNEYFRIDSSGQEQIMEVDWHPIENKVNLIDGILVTIRNVTQVRQLQTQAEKSERNIHMLTEMVQAEPKRLHRFWRDCEPILEPIRRQMKDSSHALNPSVARDLHTLKGIARSLGLRHLTSSIHNVEHKILSITNAEESRGILHELLELFQAYLDLYKLRLSNSEALESRVAIPREKLADLAEAWMQARSDLNLSIKHFLCQFFFHNVLELCEELKIEGRDLAKSLGKGPVDMRFKGPLIFLPDETDRTLRYAFIHFIRNSIDHGINTPQERKLLGKSELASIELNWEIDQAGREVIWSYRDDGRGLDLDRIQKQAEARGLLPDKQPVSPLDIARCIFQDGFSLAATVTEISGRGLGMAAALEAFSDQGGSMDIELEEGPSSAIRNFRILGRLPLSRFIS